MMGLSIEGKTGVAGLLQVVIFTQNYEVLDFQTTCFFKRSAATISLRKGFLI